MVHTHYGQAMVSKNLSKHARQMALWLIAEQSNHVGKEPLLIYSGMSGVSYATAVALTLNWIEPEFQCGQLYIRKDTETSHSNSGNTHKYDLAANIPHMWDLETPERLFELLKQKFYPVFVDDFVSSGGTFMRCFQRTKWSIEEWVFLLEGNPVACGVASLYQYDSESPLTLRKGSHWYRNSYPTP